MQNPFDLITSRLSNIEALLLDIKYSSSPSTPTEPYGDFHWLRGTCPGVPASTLRIKSAAGEIPGVVKFGKRVLYDKAIVLSWLRDQTRKPINAAKIERATDEQISQRLAQKGGLAA